MLVGSGCLSDSLRPEQGQVIERLAFQQMRVGKMVGLSEIADVRPVPSQLLNVPQHDTMSVATQRYYGRLLSPTFSNVPLNRRLRVSACSAG